MKLTSFTGSLSLVTLAALGALYGTPAFADDPAWYIGASAGRSRATIDDAGIATGLLGGGLTMTSIVNDDHHTGYKLFGGYQWTRNLAIEAGYYDLGEFGFTATTSPPGSLVGNIRLRGLNLDALATLPLSEKFSVFGRVGAASTRASDSFSGTGAVHVLNPDPSRRQVNPKIGLGLSYDFTPSLAVRLEGERYRVNDAVGNRGNIDMVSMALVYRFGDRAPAYAPRPAPVAYVAPAPVPQPVVVMAPPPPPPPPAPVVMQAPAPRRISLSADSLFDFDKAVLKPGGRQELDKLAQDLRGMQYSTMSVTGHTDRIGSHAYNQKLSERRAETVSTYLVQSGGVMAGKITTRGVDGADPVTKPGDCKGTHATPALIACLQPDRRVDVEVTGTR